MKYEEIDMKFILFEKADIITTSSEDGLIDGDLGLGEGEEY